MKTVRLRDEDRVLLVRLGAVGDVVRTLPCLAHLRKEVPGVRLGWVVEPPSSPLLPKHPWLDEVLLFPRRALRPEELLRHPAEGIRALRKFVADLRAFRASVSIDFQGSAKSSLIGWLSGAPVRLGFDSTGAREGSHLLSNLRVRPSSARLNRIHKNLELLAPLLPGPGELTFPFRAEGPTEEVRRFMGSLGGRLPVAVHAGTSRKQDHKQWPAENFARLVAQMAGRGWAPVLTWGPGEEDLIAGIQRQSNNAGFPTPPLNIEEMRQVIASCRLFVGADTGPMHLAWSQGVPVVALFGSTDPRINGPLGQGHRVLAPSWDGTRPPPARGERSAIERIDPETVFQAALEVLSRGPGSEARAPAG